MWSEVGWATAATVLALVSSFLQQQVQFSKEGSCVLLEPYLTDRLVGQDGSIQIFTDAICDHVTRIQEQRTGVAVPGRQKKPLVVSIHGPPGVGKTYLHQLTARVLYKGKPVGTQSKRQMRRQPICPGRDCPGYKVLFGMDYTSHDREHQHMMLQKSLLEHIKEYPQSFLVIEEYDKLDCYMRGFFRQILQGGYVGNQSLEQAIVVLESNLGFSLLHKLLQEKGDRHTIPHTVAQKELKDMVFGIWRQQECEAFSDSQKLIRTIDFFLPFYPLQLKHMEQLFKMRLDEFRVKAVESGKGNLTYDDSIIKFLVDKVEFDDIYPIEGGKEVNTVTTGYLSRPFRRWMGNEEQHSANGSHAVLPQFSWKINADGSTISIIS